MDAVAAAKKRASRIEIESREDVRSDHRTGTSGESREVDPRRFGPVMTRHDPGHHARVGERRVGRDERDDGTANGAQRESSQYLDMAVAASREQEPRARAWHRSGNRARRVHWAILGQ